ncbi:MAG: SDR family oxidoreductase [Thiohalocapsa sp.]|nr:SDR family oxidoreductase [Thiohalocapsa sp.]
MTAQRLFCFGLGYTGLRLAHAARALGWQVAGTCRTAENRERLRQAGIAAYVFDGSAPMADAAAALAGSTLLLCSVPPDAESDPVLRLHRDDIGALAGTLRWIGLLSTSGVYGDCGGAWIDESRQPSPLTGDNRRRVEAEQSWLALGAERAIPAHVFRLPGIYGPDGRSAVDAVLAGRARRIVKRGQIFNRIHVDDLVTTLLASMQRPCAGRVYNVSDDEPAPADAVIAYAATLLGMEPPPEEPFEDAELSPFARHFYSESRRLRNERIKRELGVVLRYPSYREGLGAIAGALTEADRDG